MSNGNGHHWSKFSWRDWRGDPALHPCSLAAKGFWMELLCIMHEGSPVGCLTIGGKPATIRQMAANAYCSEKEATKYLAELEEAGVFSRKPDGTIYSRRMEKDAAASEAGREHVSKRWNGNKSPDPPIRGANREPISEASSYPTSPPYRNPNTKSTELELEVRPPVGPHEDVGPGAPAAPGAPPRRADGTNLRAIGGNPRAVGTNPREIHINPRANGTNPRRRNFRNGFHDLAREMDAEEGVVTIEGTSEPVDFTSFYNRMKAVGHG